MKRNIIKVSVYDETRKNFCCFENAWMFKEFFVTCNVLWKSCQQFMKLHFLRQEFNRRISCFVKFQLKSKNRKNSRGVNFFHKFTTYSIERCISCVSPFLKLFIKVEEKELMGLNLYIENLITWRDKLKKMVNEKILTWLSYSFGKIRKWNCNQKIINEYYFFCVS